MNKYQLNIVVSLALILFGIILMIAIPYCVPFSNIHSGMSNSSIMNSHFMPKVVVYIMWLSSAVNIVLNILNLKDAKKAGHELPKEKIFEKDELGRVLVYIAIFVLYTVLLNFIGFIASSIICCALILLFLKVKKWWYYAIDIAFIVAVYFIFKYLLYVQL